jgi:phage baseplate assembly protein W
MDKSKIFVGFSTAHASKKRSWALYDIDLIKQDLKNHFYTRKGERPMRPTFGCAIWDLIGEQLTNDVVELCHNEVERIISLDTRVERRGDIKIDIIQNGLVVSVDLYYRPYDIVEKFRLQFEKRQ